MIVINTSDSEAVKKLECRLYESNFNNLVATVEQKQKYADCIETLYPAYTGAEIIFFKCLLVVSVIVAGFAYHRTWKWENDHFFCILTSLTISICVYVGALLVAVGLCFLFN